MAADPIRYWQALTTLEAADVAGRDPVLVLPLAAIEQHGPHLPLSTDLEIGLGLLRTAFAELEPDHRCWMLPPQALGASLEHHRFSGTLALDAGLLFETIRQQGAAVAGAGVRRLVLANSHGGNTGVIKTAALRLRADHGMLVVTACYPSFGQPDEVDLPPGEWRHGLHGGAVETAMMLHLRPDLVRTDRIARFASLGEELRTTHVGPEGPAPFAWLADDLHPQGVTGDARLATADLGRRLVTHYGRVLAAVLRDAASFPLDRLVSR